MHIVCIFMWKRVRHERKQKKKTNKKDTHWLSVKVWGRKRRARDTETKIKRKRNMGKTLGEEEKRRDINRIFAFECKKEEEDDEEEENCSKNSLLFYSHLRLVFVVNICNFIQREKHLFAFEYVSHSIYECVLLGTLLCALRPPTPSHPNKKKKRTCLFVYTLLLQCKHRSVSTQSESTNAPKRNNIAPHQTTDYSTYFHSLQRGFIVGWLKTKTNGEKN